MEEAGMKPITLVTEFLGVQERKPKLGSYKVEIEWCACGRKLRQSHDCVCIFVKK
jgi:hypothetical protein